MLLSVACIALSVSFAFLVCWGRRRLKAFDEEAQRSRQAKVLELAPKLAELLRRGLVVGRTNPYFGGMGLRYVEGTYVYAPVNDADIAAPSEVEASGMWDADRREFRELATFELWLYLHLSSDRQDDPTEDISIKRIEQAVIWGTGVELHDLTNHHA